MILWVRKIVSAAHRLDVAGHPEMHGHTYAIRSYFQPTGFRSVEALAEALEPVRARFDHKLLNDILEFPTMEMLATAWFDAARAAGLAIVGAEIEREEVGGCGCAYWPEGRP